MKEEYMEKEQSDYKFKSVVNYVPKEKQLEFECEMKKIIGNLQEEAFMQGYCYAIQLLQDSVAKKKPT